MGENDQTLELNSGIKISSSKAIIAFLTLRTAPVKEDSCFSSY